MRKAAKFEKLAWNKEYTWLMHNVRRKPFYCSSVGSETCEKKAYAVICLLQREHKSDNPPKTYSYRNINKLSTSWTRLVSFLTQMAHKEWLKIKCEEMKGSSNRLAST